MQVAEPLFEYIKQGICYEMLNDDCLTALRRIENEKFDLILTSPPYNVGKVYETKTSIERYLATQEEVIINSLRSA